MYTILKDENCFIFVWHHIFSSRHWSNVAEPPCSLQFLHRGWRGYNYQYIRFFRKQWMQTTVESYPKTTRHDANARSLTGMLRMTKTNLPWNNINAKSSGVGSRRKEVQGPRCDWRQTSQNKELTEGFHKRRSRLKFVCRLQATDLKLGATWKEASSVTPEILQI